MAINFVWIRKWYEVYIEDSLSSKRVKTAWEIDTGTSAVLMQHFKNDFLDFQCWI